MQEDGSTKHDSQGFTLIEIITVVAIMAVFYSVAIPKLNFLSGTEMLTRLGRFSADIRAAYDLSVLSNRPHRIVLIMATGEYWLEAPGSGDNVMKGIMDGLGVGGAIDYDMSDFNNMSFTMGDEKIERELNANEEKSLQEEHEVSFQEYESMNGPEFDDKDNNRVLKAKSPLISAKDALKPQHWTRVENREWAGKRSFGGDLIVKDMQAEHYETKQTVENSNEQDRVTLYFFPNGYVEHAYFHVGIRKSGNQVEENGAFYTLETKPYQGTAEMVSGYKEVEINAR